MFVIPHLLGYSIWALLPTNLYKKDPDNLGDLFFVCIVSG